MTAAVRTPDNRFADLPGWPYEPRYTDIDGLRMHHVDEGPVGADPILCLHGEPSWGYLYRKMIPPLVTAGHRVVVPDLIGFGRSDKPTDRADYTYRAHVDWAEEWLLDNDLTNITLVCQDWGGLIGLRLVAAHPDRFARVVTANTFLPTGDRPPTPAFLAWQQFSQLSPKFDIGRVIANGCVRPVSDEVVAAYNAPFPDDTYKAGARQFPALVPTSPDDPASGPNIEAWKVLESWTKPWLTAFSDGDPITKGSERHLHNRIPGTNGQAHTTIVNAGHFLQEDAGEELAAVVAAFIAANPR